MFFLTLMNRNDRNEGLIDQLLIFIKELKYRDSEKTIADVDGSV